MNTAMRNLQGFYCMAFNQRTAVLFTALLLHLPCSPLLAEEVTPSPDGPFLQGEVLTALVGEVVSLEGVVSTLGYGVRAGYRWGDWGLFGLLEHDIWLKTDIGNGPVDSVLNIGLGGEVRYFGDRVSTKLAMGTSTALFATILDEWGTTGIFFDIKPTGFRFPALIPLNDGLLFEVTPLSFVFMAPIVEGIPLVHLAFRTTALVEF